MATVIAISSEALANDGFGALGVGGVVLSKTDHVALVREVLDVSTQKITVDYDFLNESKKDITSTLIFPLPTYRAVPSGSGIVYKGQPLDFAVLVNGKNLPFRTEVRVLRKGVDITSKILKAGLTPMQIARLPFILEPVDTDPQQVGTKQQRVALKKAGLLDALDLPDWDIQVSYQWDYKFPSGKPVHVRHYYRPFGATGTTGGYGCDRAAQLTKKMASNFCVAPKVQDHFKKLCSNKKNLDVFGQIPGTIVNYILTTANSWKDGIRDFTLRLHKASPDDVISLCFPAELKKINDMTFEAHIRNFKPRSELAVHFGNREYEHDQTGSPPIFKRINIR